MLNVGTLFDCRSGFRKEDNMNHIPNRIDKSAREYQQRKLKIIWLKHHNFENEKVNNSVSIAL